MNDNSQYSYISTVITPDNQTHYVKDAEARAAITGLETSKQDKISGSNKLPVSNVSGLATVATSGSYNDLANKPNIPAGVIVDAATSTTSTNAISNKAITEYVNNKISELGSYLTFKGTKTSESAIKAIASAKVGDVWLNSADGSEWVCITAISAANANAWEKLGYSIDLTPYAKSADLKALAYKASASASYTPAGSVAVDNYTPEGTVSAPEINVVPNTATVYSITGVGSLPTWSASVANETLSFEFSQGSLPTKGTGQTVATGIKSASATQPVFTGAAKAPTASFSGTAETITIS